MESLNEENSIGDICNMIKKKVKKIYITEFQKRERKTRRATIIIERLRIFQTIMNSKHCRKQANNPPLTHTPRHKMTLGCHFLLD